MLFHQLSELGSPNPSPAGECAPPLWFRGEGHTRLQRRGWESPNSDEGTMRLQLYTFFGISIGIKRRLIDMKMILKMYSFFAFAFEVYKKCYNDPKIFFLEKYQYGYLKNAEADFKSVDAGFQRCP
jgi:hypothetical protein